MSTAGSHRHQIAVTDHYTYQPVRQPSPLLMRVGRGVKHGFNSSLMHIGTFLNPIWAPFAVFARRYLGSLYGLFFPWRSDVWLLCFAAAWYVVAGTLAAWLPIFSRSSNTTLAAAKFGAAGGLCAGLSSLIVLRLLGAVVKILQGRTGAKFEKWTPVVLPWLAWLILAFGIPPLVCSIITTYAIGRVPPALMIASAVTGAPLLPAVSVAIQSWPIAETHVSYHNPSGSPAVSYWAGGLVAAPIYRVQLLSIFEPGKLFTKKFRGVLLRVVLLGFVATWFLSFAGFVFIRISILRGFELCSYSTGAIAGFIFGCFQSVLAPPSLLIFRRRRYLRACRQAEDAEIELGQVQPQGAHRASGALGGSLHDRQQQDLPDMISLNPPNPQQYPSHLLSEDLAEPRPLITPSQSQELKEYFLDAEGIHDTVLAAAVPLYYGSLTHAHTIRDQEGQIRYSIRSPRRPSPHFVDFVRQESANFLPPHRFGDHLLVTDRSRFPPPLSSYRGLLSTGPISGVTTPQSPSSRGTSPTRMTAILPKNYTIDEVYTYWSSHHDHLHPIPLRGIDPRDLTGVGRVPWKFIGPLKLFDKGRTLGGGRFCDQVRLVRSRKTGHVFARKSVKTVRRGYHRKLKEPLPKTQWISHLKLLKREQVNLAILKEAGPHHPHLVMLQGSYRTFTKFGLLLLPVADMNLRDFFEQCYSPDTVEAVRIELRLKMRSWFGCLASAVAFVHKHGIIHWDIRPHNILYKRQGGRDQILLSDFNASQHVGPSPKGDNSKRPDMFHDIYAAPELFDGEVRGLLDGKCYDIFSLGCVYLEMLSVVFGRSAEQFDRWRQKHPLVQEMRFSQHVKSDTLLKEWWLNEHVFDLRRTENPDFNGLLSVQQLVFRMLSLASDNRPVAGKIKFPGVWSGRCCVSEKSGILAPTHAVELVPVSTDPGHQQGLAQLSDEYWEGASRARAHSHASTV